MATIEIDARGLPCPGPIVEIFKAISTIQAGDIINIEADDRAFISDIKNYCGKTGHKLLKLDDNIDIIKATIQKS